MARNQSPILKNLLLLAPLTFGIVKPFSLPSSIPRRHHPVYAQTVGPLFSIFEYEYASADDKGEHDYRTNLPSVYPEGTPAGLRGEAVRSALRSTQCLTWQLATTDQAINTSPNLASGILELEGKGVLDFLNNKLSNSFFVDNSASSSDLKFVQAGLLTPKGRLVDILSVAFTQQKAFVMPSPGHSANLLFEKLDPFIFPMDQVNLKHLSDGSFIFTLASTRLEHVHTSFREHFIPKLKELISVGGDSDVELPLHGHAALLRLDNPQHSESSLLVLPTIGLPDCSCVGYTFVFLNDHENVGEQVWQYMIGEANAKGPIEIQALEYETLRIEAGQPAFGFEITGAWKHPPITSATPLELHLNDAYIDMDKGCYLGQEGIASIVKNPRGPPRSLYSVVFEDDDNLYQNQSEGDNSKIENLTRLPKPGDALFVLGSNEEIQVGTITSIAEPYSTGESTIIGLSLVRRADSILKQMKSKNLQIPRNMALNIMNPNQGYISNDVSGMIAPPPLDSLDGLEVIVGGTFTVGTLRVVPSRRYPRGENMYMDQEQVFLTRQEILDQGYVDIEFSGQSSADFLRQKKDQIEETGKSALEESSSKSLEKGKKEEDAAAAGAAEAAASQKEEKMEMLKQRAAEAMARRRKKKQEASVENSEVVHEEVAKSGIEDDAEAKRKAEKMEMLRRRTEEAKARRRQKNR